jgi:peptidoglycan/LPS O-acetylase OafA/YrhL
MSSPSLLTRSPHERFYHPELEPLRFVAFLLIFLHHSLPHEADFYSRFGFGPALSLAVSTLAIAGCFGVQLFLLLSAYLVTELLIRERALRGQVDLRAFYSRRFLRIWPLYYFFLALAWAMQWFVPGQHLGWRAGLAFAFFAGNWWIIFVGFPSSAVFHLWFISMQEQFYFVWPALMRKLAVRGLLIAAAILIAAANLTRWYLVAHDNGETEIWCNTFAELDSIGLGVLLAVLLAGRIPRLSPLKSSALFLAGTVGFSLAASYFKIKGDPLTTPRIVLGYPCAVLGALAFFLATLRPQPDAQPNPGGWPTSASRWRMWGLAPLTYLGGISYGLYVFHILGLIISDRVVPHQDSSFGRYVYREAVALAFTLAFASISYFCLEKPFLTLKKRFSRAASGPAA